MYIRELGGELFDRTKLIELVNHGFKVPGKVLQSSSFDLAQCDLKLKDVNEIWPRLSPQLRDVIWQLTQAVDMPRACKAETAPESRSFADTACS